MNIKISPPGTREASERLREASRRLRGCQEEVDHIMNDLQDESELDGCRIYLRRQQEHMEKETADLVRMSVALDRITLAYERNERKSEARISGEVRPKIKGFAPVKVVPLPDTKPRHFPDFRVLFRSWCIRHLYEESYSNCY